MAARQCLRRLRCSGSSDTDTLVHVRFLDLTTFFFFFFLTVLYCSTGFGGHVKFWVKRWHTLVPFGQD